MHASFPLAKSIKLGSEHQKIRINSVQAVMEAVKSHDLLSASGRTRKAGCVIQSKSEGLRPGALRPESRSPSRE